MSFGLRKVNFYFKVVPTTRHQRQTTVYGKLTILVQEFNVLLLVVVTESGNVSVYKNNPELFSIHAKNGM